jgi:signal transduction histidine kinase
MIATGTGRRRAAVPPVRLLSGSIGRTAIGLLAVGVGIVSLRTAQASLGFSYLTESAASEAIGLAAGWGLVAVGLETWRRGRRPWFGRLLTAAGIAWFLQEWSDPAVGAPLAFTVGLAFGWSYPAVVGHALIAIAGTTRQGRLDRVVVAVGHVLFVIGLGLIPALGFDPRASDCSFCPANLIQTGAPPAFVDGATHVAAALAVGWTVAAALILAFRLTRSGPIIRQVRLPILIPGIGFLVLVATTVGRTVVTAVPPTDPTDHLLRLGQGIVLVALGIGVASEWFRARRTRGRVARVVADLAESPVGGLRDHLATILRDPDLRLGYPVGGDATVDAGGRPIDLGPRPGRMTTPIVRDGGVVAVIEHDVDVLRDPGEVDEVIAAARLGLEHERLHAEAGAQLDTLRAARRRIVDAGDAHRRRLERDLHDGAQQHLIAVSIALRLVEPGPDIEAVIADAAADLRHALDDLREVAHGIYPTVLGDEGFAAAVDALAETSRVPVVIREMVEQRFDPAIEVAAYHVVADTVRVGTSTVEIRARQDGGTLRVEVSGTRVPVDVTEDIADRVGAVDGTVAMIEDGSSATTLIAEIPCGS